MMVDVQAWKEGKNIIMRNEKYHINTYGKTLDEALENFHDALLLNVEGEKEPTINLVLSYPTLRKNVETQKAK